MIKKIDLANEALSVTGLVSSSNPATAEMTATALKALERSMLKLGLDNYIPSESITSPNPNEDSGVTPQQFDDVIKYISLDICEALAAPFTGEMKTQQYLAKRRLTKILIPSINQRENMPNGAGSRRYNNDCYFMPVIEDSEDGSDNTTT